MNGTNYEVPRYEALSTPHFHPFSITLNLHSSLNVKYDVSQPYSANGNIVFCIF